MTRMARHQLEVLADLADTIASRRGAPLSESYTAKLLSQGREKCAKKLGEEAVELALAGALGNKDNVASEAADLLYHVLVLLEANDVKLSDVMMQLQRRQGTSGIAEKAARPKD